MQMGGARMRVDYPRAGHIAHRRVRRSAHALRSRAATGMRATVLVRMVGLVRMARGWASPSASEWKMDFGNTHALLDI